MRRKHHRRYRGLFTRLASRYRSLFTFVWAFLALLSGPGFNGPAHAQSATYRVTFEGKFTASALASGVSVPSGEHFTTLIGAVHNGGATFWSSGALASAGVEGVAELGNTDTFESEINANMNAVAVIEKSLPSGGTPTATVDLTVTTDHPLVTLLSMIAPSPDWFVGVSGLSLRNATDDGWQPSLTVELFPYDAGTEEGTEFSLSNTATSPQGTITSIKGTGKFSNEPIASLTFTRQSVTPEITSETTFTVDEGTTAVETLTANDQDSATADLAWSKAGGADAGQFTLSTDGDLAFAAAPDYENPDGALRFFSLPDYETPPDMGTDNMYSVTVSASDGSANVTKDMTVTVTDRDEAGALPLSSTIPRLGTPLTATVTDSDGVTGTTRWISGSVLPAGPVAEAPRVVRGPYLQSGTSSSVIVKWRTDEATDSLVRYGLDHDPDGLRLSATNSTSTTEHAVELTGLSADVKYFYSVGSSSALQLAGGDSDHFVVTAPVPGTAKPTRIWVIGDSGTADRNSRAVRDAFLNFTGSRDPDLWIMLGDNAYYHGTDNEYQRAVFNTYPQVLPKTVLWPTLGNHDGDTADSTTESGPYYDIFSLPRNGEAGGVPSGTEAYYSFDYGNMHFVCLNSETDPSPDGAMMTWLEADLAANDKEWVIAFWHRAPYSRGSANSDTDDRQIALRQNAVPLLERYGVDLVLTGHTHAYERSYLIDGHYGLSDTFTDALKKGPGDGSATGDGAYRKPATVGAPHAGAVYVVAGNAGVIKTGGSLDHPAMAASFWILGSMVLDVNGNRLDAKFLGSTGDIWDDFTILKLPEVSGSVAENTAAGEGVVTVADENPEDDLTYTLAGANGNSDHTPFTITAGGELQTRAALDYEQPADAGGNNIYEVVVSGEDGEEENGKEAGTDDSVLVTIHVTDMDEAGTVSLPPDPPQALTPLTARLDDPDRDAGHTVSWQWASSANRTGPWTAIGGATAPSYTPQASDVTKYLRATATYEDRHARNQSAFSDASAQVTAHVQSVAPEAPEITSAATFTVDEGTTAVETLTAEDQDSAAADLEWSKAGGADADDFTLSTDGDLAFAAAPDYENPDDADGDRTYEITVQVSDGDNPVTADIRVTLQNVVELFTELEGPSSTDYAENRAVRVATFIASSEADRDGIAWHLSGDDDDHFSIDNPAGILRFHIDPDAGNSFPKLPDYEMPDDKDANNAYAVTVLAQAGSAFTSPLRVTVTVTDENEAGAISLSTVRPKAGDEVTAELSDPDEVSGTPAWQWERSAGRNTWEVIAGAGAAGYTPTAADTGAYLRVTATYTDSHAAAQSAHAVSAEVVAAELLSSFAVTTNASTADPDTWALRPEFSTDILRYAVGCDVRDTMRLAFSAETPGTRVAVNGIQVADQNATFELTVKSDSDVPITLATGTGTSTTYVVHCMDSRNPAIERAGKEPGAATELLSVYAQIGPTRHQIDATYLAIIDANGVPRWQRRLDTRAIHFKAHRDGKYPYSYGHRVSTSVGYRMVILDENLDEVDRVTTTSRVQHTGAHDFAIRENGNYVFEAYEPTRRDFSAYTDADGNAYATIQLTDDSVIEEVNPDGERVFFWNSWNDMYLDDCRQHRFPNDYAHINSVQVVDGADIIASFRGCSQVWRIDREAETGEWLLGRSNRSDAEWEADGIQRLKIVGDPHGEFCGQHSARLIPNGHLLLFDNGNHCLEDPETGDTQRPSREFSRVVEYALDPDNGEAVFVRQHCQGNTCTRYSTSQGHIERMDSGHWLASWGRGGGNHFPEASVTEVDPLTNDELLAFKITHPRYYQGADVAMPTRAYPVEFVALADTPGPLTAEIVQIPASPLFHLGPTDAPKVVVAFSRPVADFAADTTSVSLSGATIAGISPHVVAGDPANAYLFTLTPAGVGPITFAPVAGRSCASGGICTADGTVLTQVPASHVIPPRPTGPAVVSIASSATHPTKDGFTVTIAFSEPVMGLTADEIEVTKGTGSNFGGAGESYTLEIAPDAGIEDEVTVTVTAGAVVDGVNNGNLQASEAFPVDTKAPVVSTVTITSDPGPDRTYAAEDEIRVTVTFSETVEVTGRPGLRLELGGGNRTATYGGGTGRAALVFTYQVAGGESDTDGVGVEADSLSGGTIRDGSDNEAVLDHDGLAADGGHKVDAVKPELAASGGAVVNGTALTLTWDEPLDGSSIPASGDFTVAGGDRVRTVTRVRVSGSTVTLTLDAGAEHEEAGIRVSYTPGTNRIRDAAGNEAEGLSREPVTNETPDTTPPEVESLGITSNPGTDRTYAVGDEIEVTVTFSETVEVEGTPQLRLRVGSRTRTAGYLSGTGTAALVFGYEVAEGDEDTSGVSVEANRLTLKGGTIKDEADNPAELAHGALAPQAGHQVDGVRPAFVGAGVDGSSLTLSYGEALDGGSRPASGDFTVEVEGSGRSVTGVSLSGSVVTLFLNPAVEHGDTGIRVSYTPGTNPIRDLVGNDAQGLSNRSVTNTTDAPNTAPEIASPSSFDVPENQALVRRLEARDTDAGDEVTGWEIVGGADRSEFSIAPDTGELSFREAPDFEAPGDNEYEVTVEVSSGAAARELTAEQTLAVRVTDEREPPEVPDAPTFSGETADSLRVSWSEPDNTGPTISDYDVQYRKEGAGGFTGAPHQGPGRTLTLADLEPGTVYEVQVRATNDEGTGDWSESGEGMTVTPLTVQMTTGLPPPVEGAFSLRLSFSETVTGFTLADIETRQAPDCRDENNVEVPCDPPLTIVDPTIAALQTTDDRIYTTTLSPRTTEVNHNYTLTLTVPAGRAISAAGNKPNEAATLDVRIAPPGVTAPISSLRQTASPGNGQVTLRWNAPANTGGAPIVRYEYRWRESGAAEFGDWVRVAPAARAATVRELTNGREYVFEARGVNALGYGPVETARATPSPPPFVPPPPPPPTPQPPGTPSPGGGGGGGGGRARPPSYPGIIRAEGGDGEVTLTWEAPASRGSSRIEHYEYRIDGEGEWISTGSTGRTHTIAGLIAGRIYFFHLRAVSAAGAGSHRISPKATPVADLDFTHFANGGFITSTLALVNAGAYPVRPAIYFYDQDGDPIAARRVVELTPDLEVGDDGALRPRAVMHPLEELTIATHGRGGLRAGSVTVRAPGSIGGVLRFDIPGHGVAGVGDSPTLRDALVPVRRQDGGVNTGVAVRNRGTAALTLQCRLMQDGAVLEETIIPLAANGQDSRFIDQVFPAAETSDFAGSVRCTAPEPGRFSAVAFELDGVNRIFTTLPVVPVPAVLDREQEQEEEQEQEQEEEPEQDATRLDFTHFANGGKIVSSLVLLNAGADPVRPAIYFHDQDGGAIPAESMVDITGDMEIGDDGALRPGTALNPLGELTISTHGRGVLKVGSVAVTADGPIGGVLRFDIPGLGVAGVGDSPPVRDALVPVRRQDGGINTGVAVHNRGAAALLVRCRLMRAGTVLEETMIPLAANGQDSRFIDQVFPTSDTSDFSGSVRCMTPEPGLFSAVAFELDGVHRIFTTLPVVPVVDVP